MSKASKTLLLFLLLGVSLTAFAQTRRTDDFRELYAIVNQNNVKLAHKKYLG